MRDLQRLFLIGFLLLVSFFINPVNLSSNVQAKTSELTASANQVSGGNNHSCALTSSGGVVCWGDNSMGQLGDGTRTMRSVPTQVVGLSSGVQAVVTGQSHSCALTNAGGIKCWGYNFYGQLGNNSNSTVTTPVDVFGLSSGVSAITAGSNHTCALTSGGAVKCWGLNTSGQLGNGGNTNSNIPVDVNGLSSGVSGIGAGNLHSCARLVAGGAKCWGSNSGGQLGNGSTTNSNIPVDVNSLSGGLLSIDGGEEHTCALTASGSMFCWGRNSDGRLGDDTYSDKTSPVQVFGLASGVSSITAGGTHSCAVINGGLKCWGDNQYGQLGDGTTSGHDKPAFVSGLSSGVISVGSGDKHTCALLGSGGLKCFGNNLNGQLGDGTAGKYLVPVTVFGLNSGVSGLSAGYSHTCALTTGGGIKCWGANYSGQLGIGSNQSYNIPQDVNGISSGSSYVSAGLNHTCAIVNGGVKCWGYNNSGQLGNGSNFDSNLPVSVTGLSSGIVQVSAGGEHSCALTNTGTVKCWGLNNNGQLGDGTTANSNIAVNVSGLPATVAEIATGNLHTCALTTTGGVYCWGDNAYGQLGTGNTTDSPSPISVSGLSSGVNKITTGDDHSCAILTGGGVKCWGKNYSGQVGVGGGGTQLLPVDVTNLNSGTSSLDGGSTLTCAIVNGGAMCWGSNTDGQLGDGTGTSTHIPVSVSGLSSNVLQITAGSGHACAVVTPSEARCWGNSDDGEVGTGIPTYRTTPVPVSGFEGSGVIYLPLLVTD